MTAYSEDHVALAAEYALGTLDADERTLVETMMLVDPGFRDMVEVWDRTLAPLHQMVAAVAPSAELWTKIKTAAGLSGRQAPIVLPDVREIKSSFETPRLDQGSDLVVGTRPVPVDENVQDKPVPKPAVVRSLAGRVYGTVMTAIAAGLAAVIGLQIYRPESLPEPLRIKPHIQTVEVKVPAPPVPAQLVAVLQSNATEPAFILTVDTVARTYTVRRVGAPPEPDKSYELWMVSAKLDAPRSLGIIGGDDFTQGSVQTTSEPDVVNDATYAVTLEQKGGSPTGAPTSQPLWTGKLFESVPAHPSGQ